MCTWKYANSFNFTGIMAVEKKFLITSRNHSSGSFSFFSFRIPRHKFTKCKSHELNFSTRKVEFKFAGRLKMVEAPIEWKSRLTQAQ